VDNKCGQTVVDGRVLMKFIKSIWRWMKSYFSPAGKADPKTLTGYSQFEIERKIGHEDFDEWE
jgi:hypothetical protein